MIFLWSQAVPLILVGLEPLLLGGLALAIGILLRPSLLGGVAFGSRMIPDTKRTEGPYPKTAAGNLCNTTEQSPEMGLGPIDIVMSIGPRSGLQANFLYKPAEHEA